VDTLAEHTFGDAVLGEIAAFIAAGVRDDRRLAELALELARLQAREIPLCRKLAELRGVDLEQVRDPAALPATPTEAFKRASLHIRPETVERVFRTSGTTGGPERRGTACFSRDDMVLMDLAIVKNAARHLFPDHPGVVTRLLILAPSPEQSPGMIMAYGMSRLAAVFGREDSGFFFGPEGLRYDALCRALEDAAATGTPVTIIGASFGFVHLFERLRREGFRVALPEGSRVMDAGGFKGRSREVTRSEMLESFEELLGIPPELAVNLLGLTEHASQFYDDNIAARHEGRPARRGKQNPPWTRTWAVDPETLEPLPHGEKGLLRHLDLANGGHPFIVQTQDLGYTTEEGFEVLGRVGSAEARGCSITVDELLAGGAGGE
jgi:hypothetical protein